MGHQDAREQREIASAENAIHDNTPGEIAVITLKPTPIGADFILIEDSADGNNKKSVLLSALGIGGGPGSDTTAIHVDQDSEILGITLKASPLNADLIVIEDSADSFNKKRTTVGAVMGGGGNLQDAYDVGQSIDLLSTTGTGTLVFNATDAVAFQVQKGASNVIAMDTAGAVFITPPSGQDVRLTAVGASAAIHLNTASGDRILVNQFGAVSVTTASGQDFTVSAPGVGNVSISANTDASFGGGNDTFINAGNDLRIRQSATDRIVLAALGTIDLATAGGRDLTFAPGIGIAGAQAGGDWVTSTGAARTDTTTAGIRGGNWTHIGGAGASPATNVTPGVGGSISHVTGDGGDRLTTGGGAVSGAMSYGTGVAGASANNVGGVNSGTLTLFTGVSGAGDLQRDGISGTLQLETRAGGTNAAGSGDILFDTRAGGTDALGFAGGAGVSGDIIGTTGTGGASSVLDAGASGSAGWQTGNGGLTTGNGGTGGAAGQAFLIAGSGGSAVILNGIGGPGGRINTTSGAGGDGGTTGTGVDGDGGNYNITVGVRGTGGVTPGTDGSLIINVSGTALTWPVADGTTGQALVTDGAGQLSFGTAASSLQDAYDGGNAISTAAATPIAFTNAVDAGNLLQLVSDFAGSPRALDITMAAATTGGRAVSIDLAASSAAAGIHVEANATATGDPFRIVQGGANRVLVDGAGAIDLTSASGQILSLASTGAADVLLDAVSGGSVRIRVGGVGRIAATSTGSVVLTGATDALVEATASGTGLLRLRSVGSGLLDIRQGGTGDISALAVAGNVTVDATVGSTALQQAGSNRFLANFNGNVAITPATDSDLFLTTAGALGDIAIVTAGAGDLALNAQGGGVMALQSAGTSRIRLPGNGTVELPVEKLLVSDNHPYLNNGYTTVLAETGGLIHNYLPTATTDTVNGVYVAGIAATSNPTVVTTAAATFSAGDFIQISGSRHNNGLYEVLTHAANLLTITGVGTTGTTEDFTQDQFFAAVSDAATITNVTISIIRSGTDGIWETAAGSVSGLTFNDLATNGGNNLQQAYAVGNSIEVTTANGTVSMANIADVTDVLTIARTFAGAGEGIAVDMATGTTGIGLHVTSDAGSTGAALQVDQNGSGAALNVNGTGSSLIQLTATGAINIDSALNQDIIFDAFGTGAARLRAAGTGASRVDALGTGLAILNSVGGAAVIQTANTTRIEVTQAGAINLDSASGQGISLEAAGTGTLQLRATGTGNAVLNSVGGEVQIQNNNSTRIALTSAGIVNVTPAANQNFDVTTAGSGSIVLDALDGTGSFIVSTAGTIGINAGTQLDMDSTAATNITSGGVMSLRPAANLNLEPSATGVINIGGGFATLVDIRPFAAGADINIRAQGAGGTTTLRADSGLVSIISNANEIEFIDTGGSIITLSQVDDRALTDTAAGEVLDSATSIIAAFNRLAESTKLIQDFQPGEVSTSGTTPITRCTIVIPANTSGVDENYIIEGTALIRSSSATNESTVDVFNLTGGAALGFAWRTEMDDPANQNNSAHLRFSVIQANAAAAQTLELRFFNDGATTFITEAGLTAKRAYV